jgi:hypothetical protein
MRIESIFIPTSAPADLQAVSIACKREKTELLASFVALMEAPGVPGSTVECTMSRNISCHHRGYRLGDRRCSSAGSWRGAPHLDAYQHIRLEEENLIRELRKAAEQAYDATP